MDTQQSHTENTPTGPSIDWPIVCTVLLFLSLFAASVIWQPDIIRLWTTNALSWITQQWGWLLLLFGVFAFVFLAWLAFGRYGDIRLGDADESPEFSDFSWVSMLFCAGIGISIVNWAFIEPVALLHASPLALPAGSAMAAEHAAMYSQFHWGIIPWSIYTMATIPVAYSLYVLKQPYLRLSVAAAPILGNWAQRWPGKLIDLIVIFSIIGGVGTSLGLSLPLIASMVSSISDTEPSFTLQAVILVAWTLLFGFSVARGLSGGIRLLSDINIGLALLLLVFVAAAGPTLFLFKLWSNSLGLYLDNFIRVSLWTDPFGQTQFTQDWTIFYWAWWIAYTPMMALFVARISRGRTIKSVILNQVLWGSVGCMSFFAIWGGYALHLETQGLLDVASIHQQQGIGAAVTAVISTLPGGKFTLLAFILLGFIFLATTLDSAAYTLASISTNNLPGFAEPAQSGRIAWSVGIAGLGLLMIKIGGLDIVQVSTLINALPMIVVLTLLCFALRRALKNQA